MHDGEEILVHSTIVSRAEESLRTRAKLHVQLDAGPPRRAEARRDQGAGRRDRSQPFGARQRVQRQQGATQSLAVLDRRRAGQDNFNSRRSRRNVRRMAPVGPVRRRLALVRRIHRDPQRPSLGNAGKRYRQTIHIAVEDGLYAFCGRRPRRKRHAHGPSRAEGGAQRRGLDCRAFTHGFVSLVVRLWVMGESPSRRARLRGLSAEGAMWPMSGPSCSTLHPSHSRKAW